MGTLRTTQAIPNVQLLKQPLAEFFERLSAPANLSLTLNRLLFDALRRGDTVLSDELENVHALLDFLIACQLASGSTVIVAEA